MPEVAGWTWGRNAVARGGTSTEGDNL
jgi:hypothetical protein